jgi:HSP20 family molecular chaperone IbpA
MINSLFAGRGSLLNWDPLRLFDVPVWSPYESPVRLVHDDDASVITVDMPGVDEADIDITYRAGELLIAGKRGDRMYRYRVALGDAFDPDRIEANLDKGVLTVRAQKRPEAKPRKISLRGQKQLTA